jgi:hypothetical protein
MRPKARPMTSPPSLRPVPMPVEQWQAWRMGQQSSYPIYLEGPETAPEAVEQALQAACFHRGETLAVLYTHEGRDERWLWLYSVKVSTTKGTWRPSTNGGRPVFVGKPEAKLVVSAPVQSFAPVEPFDAFRDDPRGIDLSLVNQ